AIGRGAEAAADGAPAGQLRRAGLAAVRHLARRLEFPGLDPYRGLLRRLLRPARAELTGMSGGDAPARPAHRLPGDPAPRDTVARMIRVDHAGEYGAARIYDGQLAVLGRSRS